MILLTSLRTYVFICLGIFMLASCKDKDGNITVQKPVLAVTPTNSSTGAGDMYQFSVDASGLNKLTKLTVAETYGGKTRMILDSTFNPPKTGITFAYNYHVPDTASKDQEITLTFSLTDEKGNTTVDTETFKVAYSKPMVTLTGDKTEASHGDEVNFTAIISSSVPNLKKLEITESINGKLPTLLDSMSFAPNTANATRNYKYSVPHDVTVGQYIVIMFKAINEEGTSASATHRITIK